MEEGKDGMLGGGAEGVPEGATEGRRAGRVGSEPREGGGPVGLCVVLVAECLEDEVYV